jgi:hypothetical protein
MKIALETIINSVAAINKLANAQNIPQAEKRLIAIISAAIMRENKLFTEGYQARQKELSTLNDSGQSILTPEAQTKINKETKEHLAEEIELPEVRIDRKKLEQADLSASIFIDLDWLIPDAEITAQKNRTANYFGKKVMTNKKTKH